jgi:hypothetical protein
MRHDPNVCSNRTLQNQSCIRREGEYTRRLSSIAARPTRRIPYLTGQACFIYPAAPTGVTKPRGRSAWSDGDEREEREGEIDTECVEYLSTIRDVYRHRHPTGWPAAFPAATGSGRGRMDWIGSADRHIPRTSRADRMHMNTDRVMSAIIS